MGNLQDYEISLKVGSGTRLLLHSWINFKWFCALFSSLFCKSCSFRYELKVSTLLRGDVVRCQNC